MTSTTLIYEWSNKVNDIAKSSQNTESLITQFLTANTSDREKDKYEIKDMMAQFFTERIVEKERVDIERKVEGDRIEN